MKENYSHFTVDRHPESETRALCPRFIYPPKSLHCHDARIDTSQVGGGVGGEPLFNHHTLEFVQITLQTPICISWGAINHVA